MAARTFPLVALVSLAWLAATPPAHGDEVSDSLAYEAKRKQVLEQSPGEREGAILAAAQDLAREGYFADALDLIFSMQDSAQSDWEGEFDEALEAAAGEGTGKAEAGAYGAKPYGYLEAGADFERWDDLDTNVYGGHVRAKLEWDPPGRILDRISASALTSDRNAYFDADAKGGLFGHLLKFEGEALLEKKLWRTYGDSLDRLYLLAKLEPTTRPLGKPVALEAPAFALMEAYRHARYGSLSYRSAGIAPGLQAMSENTGKSILLSWDLRGTEYPLAEPSSNFSDGPVASGWWYGDRVAFDAETRFTTTRYNRDTSLFRSRRLETNAGGSLRTWRWLKLGLRTTGETELEDYLDSVAIDSQSIQAEYRLQGSAWSVRPQVTAEWASAYSATLALGFARGRYPIIREADGLILPNARYLYTSNDDWKAEAGFTMLTKAIFLTLSLDYEVNRVPYTPDIYIVGSSKGAGVNCNLFWKLRPWFEIDFTASATRRLELADGFTTGNISGNTLVSLGLTSRLP